MVTTLVLMVLALLVMVDTSSGGSCWKNTDLNSNCKDLLSLHVTRSECCSAEPKGEKFYSDDELHSKNLLIFFLVAHKCSAACQDGCETFKHRCSKNEKCRVRHGIPKCICDPNCAQHSLSQRGPMCGSDGRTYRSHCQLLRHNCRKNLKVKVSYFGNCKAYSCDDVRCVEKNSYCITDQYNLPHCIKAQTSCSANHNSSICGTDNQTYKSLCHMTRHNMVNGQQVKVQYHGSCVDDGTMSCSEDPKCLQCLSHLKLSAPICSTYVCPECSDDSNLPAVCGTDGNTYKNECFLRRYSCHHKKLIEVLHIDSCGATKEDIKWAAMHHKQQPDDILNKLLLETLSLHDRPWTK